MHITQVSAHQSPNKFKSNRIEPKPMARRGVAAGATQNAAEARPARKRRFNTIRTTIGFAWRSLTSPWITLVVPTKQFTGRQIATAFKFGALSLLYFVILVILTYLAALCFWVFYWIALPVISVQTTLFFDYDPHSLGQLPWSLAQAEVAAAYANSRQQDSTRREDRSMRTTKRTEELPVARTWLGQDEPFLEDDIHSPYPGYSARQAETNGGSNANSIFYGVLSPGHNYKVTLQLEVPISQANREVGMFMINTTLFSAHGFTVGSSKRPALMRRAGGRHQHRQPRQQYGRGGDRRQWRTTSRERRNQGVLASLWAWIWSWVEWGQSWFAWVPILGPWIYPYDPYEDLTPNEAELFREWQEERRESLLEEEAVYIDVILFPEHWERANSLATAKASVTLSNPFLQIHTAQLLFECQSLSFPQYLLHDYLWLTFLLFLMWCAAFNALWLFLLFAYCFCLPSSRTPIATPSRRTQEYKSNIGGVQNMSEKERRLYEERERRFAGHETGENCAPNEYQHDLVSDMVRTPARQQQGNEQWLNSPGANFSPTSVAVGVASSAKQRSDSSTTGRSSAGGSWTGSSEGYSGDVTGGRDVSTPPSRSPASNVRTRRSSASQHGNGSIGVVARSGSRQGQQQKHWDGQEYEVEQREEGDQDDDDNSLFGEVISDSASRSQGRMNGFRGVVNDVRNNGERRRRRRSGEVGQSQRDVEQEQHMLLSAGESSLNSFEDSLSFSQEETLRNLAAVDGILDEDRVSGETGAHMPAGLLGVGGGRVGEIRAISRMGRGASDDDSSAPATPSNSPAVSGFLSGLVRRRRGHSEDNGGK